MDTINILGFGGSLREGSYSQTLLETSIMLEEAVSVCPEEGRLEVYSQISEFPLYSQDMEKDMPEAVKEFKHKIKQADAVLIVTPEYDFSVPGYLKNAVDWASRPYGDNSFDDKPAAIMSASIGMLGGVKAQYAFRQAAVFLNLHLLNRPEVIIPNVNEKIKDGHLVDENSREKIKEMLSALCDWTTRLKGSGG